MIYDAVNKKYTVTGFCIKKCEDNEKAIEYTKTNDAA